MPGSADPWQVRPVGAGTPDVCGLCCERCEPSASDTQGNGIVGVAGTVGQIVVTTCTGDCNGDATVSIGEVIKCVNLFLGQPLCNPTNPELSCPNADADGSGSVSIGEVVKCVNRFLAAGCL